MKRQSFLFVIAIVIPCLPVRRTMTKWIREPCGTSWHGAGSITPHYAPGWIARLMRSPVADLLNDAAAALAEARVDWYLFGAQAAILHGVARLTADVDITAQSDLTPVFERALELSGRGREKH